MANNASEEVTAEIRDRKKSPKNIDKIRKCHKSHDLF